MATTRSVRRIRIMTVVAVVGYLGVLAVGRAVLPRHPSLAESFPFAVAAIALALWPLLAPYRAIGRLTDDVLRRDMVEATSLAFIVTMVAALSWALCQELIGAPALSACWTWTVGVGSWILISLWQQHRTLPEEA